VTLSLRTQLTLFHTAILALLVTGLGLAFYQGLSLQLDADATNDLVEVTDGLHGYLRFDHGQPVLEYDEDDPAEVAFVQRATRYYQVYEATTGRLLVQSPALEPLGLHYTPAEVSAMRRRPRVHDMETDIGRLRLSDSVIAPAPGQVYLLQVGASLEGVARARRTFRGLLLWSIPAGLLVTGAAGRWMAGRALAPLARLATAARGIDVTDLSDRLPVRGAGDELDALAGAFNDTLQRLEAAVDEMRQFSAAIAHELRTPLAALRGETELALMQARSEGDYRRALTSQLEELDKIGRLVGQLLTLARLEAGEIPLANAPVDVAALAASVAEQLEVVAQERQITLATELTGPVMVAGDRAWLERLLLNLLDNALKFTPAGGRVVIDVSYEHDRPRIEVRDTGVGMAPEVLARAFERFYRADAARSPGAHGVGLGLTLVKWIADRHGAAVDIRSRPGAGTAVTVRLPASTGSGVPPGAPPGARTRL
jgi:heavy metal sensor kinase